MNPAKAAPTRSPQETAELRADATDWLTAYRPQITDAEWTAVRSVVVECGTKLVTSHGATKSSLRTDLKAVTSLAVWRSERVSKLTLRTLLDPLTINQFAIDVKKSAPKTAATYQSSLLRVGRRLNPGAPWDIREPVSRRTIKPPYTDAELALLEADIARNEANRAHAGEALLVLGLGAGLDGRWAARCVREDVHVDADGIQIQVPGRVVTLARPFEARMRALLAVTPPGGFLIGGTATGKNAASLAMARLKLDRRTPALDLGRLRSTWIVAHLVAGTNLKVLGQQAGIVGATTYCDLLRYVPDLAEDTEEAQRLARQMMRGRP